MDNTLTVEPTAEEAAQLQKAIQQYLTEIEQLRSRMQRNQSEIEKSRARTRTMLTRLQAHLVQLQASV